MSILNPRHPHTTVHIIRRVFEATTIESEPAHEKAPVNGLRLVVGRIPFPDTHRQRVEKFFTHIHYYPDMTKADLKVLQQADVLYGFGAWNVHSFEQIPRVRFIQLASAGADDALKDPMWKDEEGRQSVIMSTAAGVHMGPIPQYFIMVTLSLFHHLQEQILISHNEKRWGKDIEVGGDRMFVQELGRKTVGVLGYGHIGRESVRLAASFGAKIIAGTSDGERKPLDGYNEPGKGDPDGSIPDKWYATKDPKSFKEFLSQSDVLLLCLPSTPATRHIINAKTLALLPPHAVVINIGRGDAVDTDALLAALDAKMLGGAALDVAEGEPLPDGHPLFGRKDVIMTPHLSGRTTIYYERAINIFEENLKRWTEGREVWNKVDFKRGY